MISVKIEGLEKLVDEFRKSEWLEAAKIDAIVKQTAQPLVERIKAEYIAGGHKKTGALVNSVEAFKRTRKSKSDPFFTYYVGPRYTSGRYGLMSYGGNAAHLLEYGTVERFRANVKEGGAKMKSGLYGARFSTGKVKSYGVIRRSTDMYSAKGIEFMKASIISLLMAEAKKRGLQAA